MTTTSEDPTAMTGEEAARSRDAGAARSRDAGAARSRDAQVPVAVPLTARERTGRRRAERRGVRAALRGLGRGRDSSSDTRWFREAGMATAEYAIATLAACGFAALLLALLRSGEVRGLLLGIIRKALAVG